MKPRQVLVTPPGHGQPGKQVNVDERTLARFMRKIEVLPNGCWKWLGRPNGRGYGRFQFDGTTHRAHRVAFEHFNGPLPLGLEPDHRCHTEDTSCAGGITCPHRLCVNPGHLEAVTRQENALRGRGISAQNALRESCVHGHRFDAINTYWTKRGNRQCRACRDAASRAWHQENPGRRRKTEVPRST